MKFRPLHDRVVIRRVEGNDKSKAGIIIPDNAKAEWAAWATEPHWDRAGSRRTA